MSFKVISIFEKNRFYSYSLSLRNNKLLLILLHTSKYVISTRAKHGAVKKCQEMYPENNKSSKWGDFNNSPLFK